MTPTLIAIAGPSAGGKTTLADALAAKLSGPGASVIPLDAYYLDLAHLQPAAREPRNFDVPNAFDWPLILAHLDALLAGRSIDMPVYDFASHTRRPAFRPVSPAAYFIVEGLYALYREEILRRCRLRVFISASPDVRLRRRIERDGRERGRSPEAVIHQFNTTVEPAFHRLIEPTAAHADLLLSGEQPPEQLVEAVLAQLRP